MIAPFIVGGCGFIGGNLVRRLLNIQSLEKLTVFDNLSSGNIKNLPNDPRVNFIHGYAQDKERLIAAMRESSPDTVFHLAANPDIAKAVTEPTIDFDQGTVLTQNVLEAMRVNSVKRAYYLSGSGVYGENPGEVFREDYGPMEPISTYGASKLASEGLFSAYCAMFGMTAVVFRPANIVGPRQTHGVGYDFLRRLKADPTKLTILGDGTQSKSYVHVSDILEAVMLVESKAVSGYDVFNVATDDYLTVNEIAKMAYELMLSEGDSIHFEYTGGARGWKGDVPVVRLNCAKLRSLGWRPARNSREAMQAALEAMAEEIR